MKKFLTVCVMVFILAMPVLNQEAEETVETEIEEYVVGYVPVRPHVLDSAHNAWVKALCIGLSDYHPSQVEWAILDFAAEWNSYQDWEILFFIVNYSTVDAKIKVEMEMLYNDGQSRMYKKKITTIRSGEIMLYYLDVTSKVRTGVGDLFTVNGRISGAGMGNSNEVKSQVLIY